MQKFPHCTKVQTGSTSSFEQKKQTHRRILMVFTRKPMWKTGLASSMCPKCPGHSEMFPAQVWHRADLSMVPWRGSMSPPSFGRPPSVTSEYLIPPSVTDMRRYDIKLIIFLIDAYTRIKIWPVRKVGLTVWLLTIYENNIFFKSFFRLVYPICHTVDWS